jgi:hypothetical protein
MKLKFYGIRGSIPVCHRDFLEFGGNTTSIKITLDSGRIAIIDAGSGLQTPMIVILIGTIGGMLLHGVIGLFVGAVVLAVMHQIYTYWVNSKEDLSIT